MPQEKPPINAVYLLCMFVDTCSPYCSLVASSKASLLRWEAKGLLDNFVETCIFLLSPHDRNNNAF